MLRMLADPADPDGAALSEGMVPWDVLFRKVLGDREQVRDDAQLPRTGMPLETERAFSSVFVEPFSHAVRERSAYRKGW